MYVFHFMDGTYRIALYTRQQGLFSVILKNKEAFKLYEGIYNTKAEAEDAKRQIEDMIKGSRQ